MPSEQPKHDGPEYEETIVCPWCNYRFRNVWEYRGDGETDCELCDKPIRFSQHITVK